MRLMIVAMLAVLLGGCAFVSVPLKPPVQAVEEEVVSGRGRAKIAVIDISGMISVSPWGLARLRKEPPLPARLREELERAADDKRVVGVVLRIDSPGGSVTASDILYHEIERFKERKGVPVVACVMGKALSGGYYAALAADEIHAHPTSVVGSVGVISYKFNLAALLARWGIEDETVKSAALKDFWSPLRPSEPAEAALMQGVVDRLHRRFADLVEARRGLKDCTLTQVCTGGIFDAGPAKALGLIDAVGYLDDAVERVRELAGVERARVVIYRRPGAYAETIYAGQGALVPQLLLLEQGMGELLGPSFRYQAGP